MAREIAENRISSAAVAALALSSARRSALAWRREMMASGETGVAKIARPLGENTEKAAAASTLS